ncbi:MAG: DASS family sodium-coupled anion symporter [Rikenellaceae bacterium]
MQKQKIFGIILGLVVFTIIMLIPHPASISVTAWRMIAVVLLIAIWWISEAINLCITALLPIILLPILGITPSSTVTLSYANEAIFLFMGGFMIALAMERSNLHKRFALHIIKIIGSSPARIILGFMIAVYILSMWVSNTATVLMVIPICLAIIGELPQNPSDNKKYLPFTKVLLLSIAYGASIGGVGTLIGTPPNIIFASIASRTPNMEITFAQWMIFAVPVTFGLLLLTWFLMVYILYPVRKMSLPMSSDFIQDQINSLGKMTTHEKRVMILFGCVAFLWIFRGIIPIPLFTNIISDTTIAIAGTIALFLVPTGTTKGEMLLDWQSASKLPWNILLLFGGGLALSEGFGTSGLSDYLVTVFESLKGLEWWVILLIVITIVVFLTELMSNTATATLLIPIMISVAQALNISPLMLVMPITMATSFAFMLPVATPPNAIVFGYNYLSIKDMVRSGFWLNIICIVVLALATLFYLPYCKIIIDVQ